MSTAGERLNTRLPVHLVVDGIDALFKKLMLSLEVVKFQCDVPYFKCASLKLSQFEL